MSGTILTIFNIDRGGNTERKWLCVTGITTPSERVLFQCGVALTAKRASMRGDAQMNESRTSQNSQARQCEYDKEAL
jgi:hypothetical protein